jgi:hypothetical protein
MTGQRHFVEQAVGSYVVGGAAAVGIVKGHGLSMKAETLPLENLRVDPIKRSW